MGLAIDIPAQRVPVPPKPSAEPGSATIEVASDNKVRAAAIQMEPGAWDAFVWSTAASGSLKEFTLDWQIGDKTGTLTDDDDPYEFSVPVPAGETRFTFTTRGIKADGTEFKTVPKFIGVSP